MRGIHFLIYLEFFFLNCDSLPTCNVSSRPIYPKESVLTFCISPSVLLSWLAWVGGFLESKLRDMFWDTYGYFGDNLIVSIRTLGAASRPNSRSDP